MGDGYKTKNYEAIFSGGYSSLSPEYGNFVGYRLNAGQLSAPTSIQSANQINEVVSRIREGARNVELQPIQQGIFDQIPKEHFKEIAALTKLTGVKTSVHAPMIDAAGFGERGWGGEEAMKEAQREIFSVVERSHDLAPDENIPIVVHSSGGLPGNVYVPEKEAAPGEEGRFREKRLVLINQETKEITGIEEQKRYELGMSAKELEEQKVVAPRDELERTNKLQWQQKLRDLNWYNDRAGEALEQSFRILSPDSEKMNKPMEEFEKEVVGNSNMEKACQGIKHAEIYLNNVELQLQREFDEAYKYGTEEQKTKLKELAEDYRKDISTIENKDSPNMVFKKNKFYEKAIQELNNITKEHAPQIFKPVEEFAMDKAAETFGEVAFKSWDKFGNNSPVLAIENMYQGMAFSRAEDMEKLVKMSRKKFVEKAVEEGESEDIAERNAKKLIGVTWDVGHLNMMRKHGFTEEDVTKETEKIAKLVKHVHLTDNFGYSDSHLAPGMGNVPFKQILEKLEKAGALDKARMVVEAGTFAVNFKTNPMPFVLSAFGTSVGPGGGYWNQVSGARMAGGYFGAPLAYMPETHFSIYGSGFSSLPEELGGQIPGTKSRFSGTDNA